MDIDYVFSKEALKSIKEMLDNIPYGKREKIADDIIAFEQQLAEKYNFESTFKNNEDRKSA